jgi:hypothetical protein
MRKLQIDGICDRLQIVFTELALIAVFDHKLLGRLDE